MSNDELDEKVALLTMQNLVLKDYVALLMAELAVSLGDKNVYFKKWSDVGDVRIAQLNANTEKDLRIAETIRKEKDWLISAALRLTGEI